MNTLTDNSKVGDESEREPEERFSVEGQKKFESLLESKDFQAFLNDFYTSYDNSASVSGGLQTEAPTGQSTPRGQNTHESTQPVEMDSDEDYEEDDQELRPEKNSKRPEWFNKVGYIFGFLFLAGAYVADEVPELLATGQILKFIGYTFGSMFGIALIFAVGYSGGHTAITYSSDKKTPSVFLVILRCVIMVFVFIFVMREWSMYKI